MKATGLFFLRTHAYVVCDATGARLGLALPVIERDPNDHKAVLNEILVKWKGSAGVAFYDKHQADLRAGRPLQLELDRLRGSDGQWQALATACELAPVAPSWQRKEAAADTSGAIPQPT